MKYVKLFETFEEEMTLSHKPQGQENPNPNSIQVGDSVESYRGMGEVIEINGEQAKVKLHNSKQNIANVPLFALTKIDQAKINSHKIRDTRETLTELVNSATDYFNYLKTEAEYSEDEEEFASKVNPEKLYELLEEILIDVMATVKNDRSAVEYEEYSNLVSIFAILADTLINVYPEYAEKIDTIYANFPS